jgi:hypothetical protein
VNSADLVRGRPYLYHLTSTGNVALILKSGKLLCAAKILSGSGMTEKITQKRPVKLQVPTSMGAVDIRDQAPLHRGNTTLHKNWDFEDLLKELNSRVFFWPGGAKGPISYGQRHFERYAAEPPAVLRFSTKTMVALNEKRIEVCKYNSGSPRCTKGKGSPRGPQTFIPLSKCEWRPSQLVEVTIKDYADLPSAIDLSFDLGRSWASAHSNRS